MAQTIANKLNRIKNSVDDIQNAISSKGGDIDNHTLLSEYADLIRGLKTDSGTISGISVVDFKDIFYLWDDLQLNIPNELYNEELLFNDSLIVKKETNKKLENAQSFAINDELIIDDSFILYNEDILFNDLLAVKKEVNRKLENSQSFTIEDELTIDDSSTPIYQNVILQDTLIVSNKHITAKDISSSFGITDTFTALIAV